MAGNGYFQPFPISKDLVNHPIDSQALKKWLALKFQDIIIIFEVDLIFDFVFTLIYTPSL